MLRERPEYIVGEIKTRDDLARFLDVLGQDAVEHGSQWENLHIFDMLESMGAWLRDSADHPAFSQPNLSSEQWRFVAELLLAGKHYE